MIDCFDVDTNTHSTLKELSPFRWIIYIRMSNTLCHRFLPSRRSGAKKASAVRSRPLGVPNRGACVCARAAGCQRPHVSQCVECRSLTWLLSSPTQSFCAPRVWAARIPYSVPLPPFEHGSGHAPFLLPTIRRPHFCPFTCPLSALLSAFMTPDVDLCELSVCEAYVKSSTEEAGVGRSGC